MSNIVEIFNDFKTSVEKEKFLEKQHEVISDLLKKNKALEEKVKHLEGLVASAVPIVGDNKVERVILTPEEALIESQIDILKNRAMITELSLEEVKKLDLLLKNKHLSKEKSPTIEAEKKPVKHLSKEQLILIATKKDTNDVRE